ncbi:hypothetical protein LIA77_03439 [Sarocladium implicatum]|nr:hypothetical protein LIA77_03439 [Sarocladium implicatum]
MRQTARIRWNGAGKASRAGRCHVSHPCNADEMVSSSRIQPRFMGIPPGHAVPSRNPESDTVHCQESRSPSYGRPSKRSGRPCSTRLAVFQADLRLVGARHGLVPPRRTNAGTGDQFRRERWANGSRAASCTCDREAEGSGVFPIGVRKAKVQVWMVVDNIVQHAVLLVPRH